MPSAEEIARAVASELRLNVHDSHWTVTSGVLSPARSALATAVRNIWAYTKRTDATVRVLRAEVEALAAKQGIDAAQLAREVASRLDVQGVSADAIVDELARRLSDD